MPNKRVNLTGSLYATIQFLLVQRVGAADIIDVLTALAHIVDLWNGSNDRIVDLYSTVTDPITIIIDQHKANQINTKQKGKWQI